MTVRSLLELIFRSRKEGDAPRILGEDIKRLRQETQKTGKEVDRFSKINKRATLALSALAAGTVAVIVSAAKLAARVETLGIVVKTLGESADYTETELEGFEEAIKSQGITTQNTLQSMAQMIQANIDLAEGADLARIAQNNAVIANINSSEAFQRLVTILQTGNIMMGRTMGLTLDFAGAQKELAGQLGTTVDLLSDAEVMQARLNEVKRAGVAIEGAYDAAMGTTGKTMSSMPRQIEEIKLAIGNIFLPILEKSVDLLYANAKAINELIKLQGGLKKQELDLAKVIIEKGGAYEELREQLEPLVEEQGKYLYTQEELLDVMPDVFDAFDMMEEGYRGMSKAHFEEMRIAEHYQGVMSGYRYTAEEAAAAMGGLANATGDLGDETEDVERTFRDVKDAVSNFWDLLREGPGLVSALERDLEAIDYSQAGADAVRSAREGIIKAADTGLITRDEAETWLGELYIAAQQIEVELDNITAYEASLNIRENIGGSLREARTAVDDLESDLADLVAKELMITIHMRYLGVPVPGPEPGYQHGGSFTVQGPPGPDRVPVGFMATAGERVTITPRGQVPSGGGGLQIGSITVSVGEGADGATIVDEMMAEIGRRVQEANISGAGFAGI